MNNSIIVLCGKGASGKDTTLNKLVGKYSNLQTCVSHTTRPMRKNEVNGREYYFIDDAEFEGMYSNGSFVETRSYQVADGNTWFYGMSEAEISDKLSKGHLIMILDINGLQELKEYYQDTDIKIASFFIDVDVNIRVQRYLDRDRMTYEVLQEAMRRVEADESDFANARDIVDYVVFNPESSDDSALIIANHLKYLGIELYVTND